MLGSLPTPKKNLGTPLRSRQAMLETLLRHLDMVRLSVSAIVIFTLMGCVGLIDGGGEMKVDDDLTPQQRDARRTWQEGALPVFRNACLVCHDGSRVGVGFLAGGPEDFAIRDKITVFDPAVVNLEAPGSSRILQKGLHEGPMLGVDESFSVLAWIQAEKSVQSTGPGGSGGPGTELLTIPAFAFTLCTTPDPATCPVNHVPLTALGDAGAAVAGAEITFVAQALGPSSIYVNNLKITSGPAGVYIEHPLFVSRPMTGDPVPDQIDRYFNLKLNVKANETVQIDGGTASFLGFDPGDMAAARPAAMLELHFKAVTPFKPDVGGGDGGGGGGGGGGGCKMLASFKTNVVPALRLTDNGNTINCSSCHVDGSGKGAMDIAGFDSADDAMVRTACNEVRTRVNLTTTDQSGIFLAPDPATTTNHPKKFAAGQFTDNFKTPVNIWVQAEKTAR